jgi:hypothetical protein
MSPWHFLFPGHRCNNLPRSQNLLEPEPAVLYLKRVPCLRLSKVEIVAFLGKLGIDDGENLASPFHQGPQKADPAQTHALLRLVQLLLLFHAQDIPADDLELAQLVVVFVHLLLLLPGLNTAQLLLDAVVFDLRLVVALSNVVGVLYVVADEVCLVGVFFSHPYSSRIEKRTLYLGVNGTTFLPVFLLPELLRVLVFES